MGLVAAAGIAFADSEPSKLQSEVRTLGWIIYGARGPSGDWDLFTCRPDGSHVMALTQTPEFHEFAPQVFPDGQRLLYRRISRSETVDGNRYGQQGVLVSADRQGKHVRVYGEPGDYPWATMHPDGKRVACLDVKGISIVDLSTRQVVQRVQRQGFFQQLTWSPDGRCLVGVANHFGTGWSIARLQMALGQASVINRVDCCTPDWFPDSQQVVFSWRPPGQPGNNGDGWTQLWRADVLGQSRQLIYGEDGRHVYGGHISPDGRYVLFTGNMEEDGDPGRAGAPMGLMRLADAPIVAGESKALRSLHPEARAGPVLILPTGWEPCWTLHEDRGAAVVRPDPSAFRTELSDRGWLIFSAPTVHGDWDLFVMRPDGSDRRAITDTREFNEAGARFSPDGRRLLYYRSPSTEAIDNNLYGTFDLILADADGKSPEAWGNGFPWASWGPEGSQIACLAPQGIQIVDVATRETIRRYPRHGIVSQLVWSPNGQRFTGTANGLGPFWNIGCLDPIRATITAVSQTDRYNCTSDWAPDSERILYARGIIPQQPGLAELWEASCDGKGRRRLYAEKGRHIYGACASPDGRYVLFTRSAEDLGQVKAIEMAVIRRHGSEAGPPELSPERCDLGPGWEPHWTLSDIQRKTP